MVLGGHKESYASFIGIPIKKRKSYRPLSLQPETPSPEAPVFVQPDPQLDVQPNLKPESAVPETTSAPPPETTSAPPPELPTGLVKPDFQVEGQPNLKPDSQAGLVKPDSQAGLVKPDSQVEGQPNLKPESPLCKSLATTSSATSIALVGADPEAKGLLNLEPESSSLNQAIPNKVLGIASSSQEENNNISDVGNLSLVQQNVNPTSVRDQVAKLGKPVSVQEEKDGMPSSSGSKTLSKGKLVQSAITAFQTIAGSPELKLASNRAHPELKLASNRALPQQVKQELRTEEVVRNDTSTLSVKLVSTELLASQNAVNQVSEDEKLDPCSWNLALSGLQPSSHSDNKNSESQGECSNLHSIRAHWDLNTMMDTWDGSSHSGVGGKGEQGVAAKCGMESMRGSKPVGTPVASGERILERSDHTTKPSSFSTTRDLPQKTEDLLHLRLSTPNVTIPEKLVSPSNSSPAASRIVKSEPPDTSNRPDIEGIKVTSLKSVPSTSNKQDTEIRKVSASKSAEHRLVKSEPSEAFHQEPKLSEVRTLKLVDHGMVKVEPVCRVGKETPRTVERNLGQSKFNTSSTEKPSHSRVVLRDLGGLPTPVSQYLKISSGAVASSDSEITTCIASIPPSEIVVQNSGETSDTVCSGVFLNAGETSVVVQNTNESSCTVMSDVVQNAAETCGAVSSGAVQNASDVMSDIVQTADEIMSDVVQNAGVVKSAIETMSDVVQPAGETMSDVVQNAGKIRGTGISGDPQNVCETSITVASNLFSESIIPDCNKFNAAAGMLCITKVEGFDVVDAPKSMVKGHPDTVGNGMVAESDDEKLNIFDDLHDDSSSETDDEPDGSLAVGDILDSKDQNSGGGQDDDYEDGEVREPLEHGVAESGGNHEGADNVSGAMSDDMDISDDETNVPLNSVDLHVATLSNTEVTDTRVAPGERENLCGSRDCASASLNSENTGVACLQEPSAIEVVPAEIEQNGVEVSQRSGLEVAVIENSMDVKEMVPSSQGPSSEGYQSYEGMMISQAEIKVGANPALTSSFLPKTEPLMNVAEAGRDFNNGANSGGNRSRIINLARAFNEPAFNRTRSMPHRPLPSQFEGERNADVFGGEKVFYRGTRDESSMGRGHKFERQGNRDQSDFMHGRGRGRSDNFQRGNWNSNRNYGADEYNASTNFRYSRPKNPSKVMVARDGTLLGGGRKPLSDELPSFRHPPGRRRSPGEREGPPSHGVRMVRRPQRNISPERCTGDGTNLIGLRRDEKFVRGLGDDVIDPVFSHPQPRYQQVEYRRGDQNFSPIQRRGPLRVPRVRSKSPGARPRSPGPWSSPRRRSPDSFGRPELVPRRSPPFYRTERVRSPRQRPTFSEDVGGRRHGSPPYISRIQGEMRDVDIVRENDHARPFIPNRSPPGRIVPRNARRFNMIDPRERIESSDYFSGPMHPGRFHELEGEEGTEERRICAERRGPMRSFRPPYDSATEVETFQFDVEGGPRSFRFSPEEDAEFNERGNIRERDFERRVKNRPGNVPRRNRSIEDQEENYRNGEQGWQGAGFDDVSGVKRRRF